MRFIPVFALFVNKFNIDTFEEEGNHEENSEKEVERENQPGQFSSHTVYLYVNLYIPRVRKGITDFKMVAGY